MPSFRYNLPKPKPSNGHPAYWLLVIAAACLVGWLWWRSGHHEESKNLPVQKLVKTVPPTKTVPRALTHTITPVPTNAAVAVPPKPVAQPPPTPIPTNTNSQVSTSAIPDPSAAPDEISGRPVRNVLEAQIALIDEGISSGSLDGAAGSQTRAAIAAFQKNNHLPITGELDPITKSNLLIEDPVYTIYVVTSNDLARLQPISPTWLGKSQQTALDYETILELVAEKSFSHPNLIRKLNPNIDWNHVTAGTRLQIPNVAYPDDVPKAAFIRISLSAKVLEAFDAETNLIAHFPCSIARRVEKRPVGELHVAVLAPDPNYTFDPAIFTESPEAQQIKHKIIIPPGPNNPVGVVWIGLDRPGYGMHGTPAPEQVGRTESHGCFRLANWNAQFLLRLVTIGTPVYVME